MVTKASAPGIFSKVTQFFREPEAAPADSQDSVQSRSGETEKQALKALIARKRQDDAVRRREFDQLRKLRKRPWDNDRTNFDPPERVSAYPSGSGFGADVRASTIKKIDAIEAHMVNSWVGSRSAGLRAEPPAVPPRKAPALPAPTPSPAPSPEEDLDLDFTGMLAATEPAPLAPAAPEASPAAIELPPLEFTLEPPAEQAATTNVASPVLDLPSLDLPELDDADAFEAAPVAVALDPATESGLQDAAMRYAEGDNAAAEATLQALLQNPDIPPPAADVVAFALFDLYRATGQQDGFDAVALAYAERFGRSPAEWFSLPTLLAQAQNPAAPATLHSPHNDAAWLCPPTLTAEALAQLSQRFANSANWQQDWSALQHIADDALPALNPLLLQWATQALQLHWSGSQALLVALAQRTPADDASTDRAWWRARLHALRVLQQQEDFENAALDYCVVYEESPPSWEEPRSTLVHEASESSFQHSTLGGPPSLPPEDLPQGAHYALCALTGTLQGSADEALAPLRAAAATAPQVVVSCALLARVDFSAAGDILNWTAECEASGHTIELLHVHRLVAVFLQLLGVDAHAKISVRTH